MLSCATCGNEEPEGARFCGSCGTPFSAAAEQSDRPNSTEAETSVLRRCHECGTPAEADAQFCEECGSALLPGLSSVQPAAEEPAPVVPEESAPVQAAADEPAPVQPAVDEPGPVALAVEEPAPVEPAPPPLPPAKRRIGWAAAGAALIVLAAGGAATAVVVLSGGDGSTEAVTTEETLPTTTTETLPPASSPTLADSIAPPLQEIAAGQTAVNARVRGLDADVPESFETLRQAGASLVESVTRAQGYLDTLAPSDSTEATTLSALRLALASHLAYANTIAFFPSGPPSFVKAQAQDAITRAEATRRAYVDLASTDPALPIVSISGFDHNDLLAPIPAPKPALPTATRRVIDLAPLMVGIRPDDPPGEGRCFGQYASRASLTVSGIVYRSGFVQCGDDGVGDPTRASGIYRFSGSTVPTATSARFTAQAAIDESSSSSQRGSSVTWTVFYAGTPICSTTVIWSGSRQTPKKLDCRIPRVGSFDVGRLRIEQIASLAATGDFWAGLLEPTVVVTST